MVSKDRFTFRRSSAGFTVTELLIVVGVLSLLAALLLPALGRAREGARRAVCQINLRTWGQIFMMYGTEAIEEKLPPMHFELLSFTDTRFAFAPRIASIYPDYAEDLSIYFCPSSTHSSSMDVQKLLKNPDNGDRSYLYLGYILDKVTAANAQRPLSDLLGGLPIIPRESLESARERIAPAQFLNLARSIVIRAMVDCLLQPVISIEDCGCSVVDADQFVGVYDGRVLGNFDDVVVHRLTRKVNGTFVVAPSKVWVMLDSFATTTSLFNHVPGGSNVLYLDGHVEFVRYPSPYTVVNPAMANILGPLLDRPRT